MKDQIFNTAAIVPPATLAALNLFPGRAAISVTEFCDAVGISRAKFYLDVKAGRVEIAKVGGRTWSTCKSPNVIWRATA